MYWLLSVELRAAILYWDEDVIRISDERAAELLAEAIQCVFEPRSPVQNERKKVVSRLIGGYLEEATKFVQE